MLDHPTWRITPLKNGTTKRATGTYQLALQTNFTVGNKPHATHILVNELD
jgi:hypothetical protein